MYSAPKLVRGPADAGSEDERASVGEQLENARKFRAKLSSDGQARLVEQLLARNVGERELPEPGDLLLLPQAQPELVARRYGRAQRAQHSALPHARLRFSPRTRERNVPLYPEPV